MSTSTLADPLFERLRRSFPADRAYTSADWDAETMPSPVRHYLDHLLHHYGQQEADRLRRARTDRVDYHHPETDQAARTFFEAIKNHAQVPADQWAGTLRTATRRTTNYLVRPVPTLTSFVFEEASGALPVSRVRWRMQFFGPYAYLRDAVQAFAKKQDRETLDPDPFEQVLRRVDEGMTADFNADRWLRLLDPLFETAHRATDRRQVPRILLRTFFEEKNASHIVERLATHEREEEADALSPDTLRSLIAAAPTEDSSERRDAPEAPLDPDLPDAPSATPPQSAESSADESADEAAPMWKQFEQHISRRSGETDAAEDDGSQPLWAQFQQRTSPSDPGTDATPSSSAPTSQSTSNQSEPDDTARPVDHDDLSALERDVFGTTNPPNRSVYVEKLFQGDENAYRRALERLRTIETWSEASQIIAKDVFRVHQVNIYSDAAVHFTNAVEAGFKEG
jgi:hypothetical protein